LVDIFVLVFVVVLSYLDASFNRSLAYFLTTDWLHDVWFSFSKWKLFGWQKNSLLLWDERSACSQDSNSVSVRAYPAHIFTL